MRVVSLLRGFPLTLAGCGMLLLSLGGWWHSSHYSERHLVYFGDRTIEFFSASSILRVSFVNGHVARFGTKTFYRQRNARGRFLVRPPVPQFRRQPDIFEVTLGYWHLAALSGSVVLAAGLGEGMRMARRGGARR